MNGTRLTKAIISGTAVVLAMATAHVAHSQTNAGTVAVGSSVTFSAPITLATAGTVGQIKFLTQGAADLDFTDAGGGSCAVGVSLGAGATCSVNVRFAPKYAGARMGAVVLADGSGSPLGTTYVYGIGQGSQFSLFPGGTTAYFPQTPCGTFSTGIAMTPTGLSADGAGNLYFACYDPVKPTASAYKWVPQPDGTWSQTQIAFGPETHNGLMKPAGVAVDGAGNVYIADAGLGHVVMEVPTASGYAPVVLVTPAIAQPQGIAIDPAGNLFIADLMNGQVVEEKRTPSGYTAVVLATLLSKPTGLALDAAGNVFFSEPGADTVMELTNCQSGACKAIVVDHVENPVGLATDASGDLYVFNNHGVFLEIPSSAQFTRADLGIVWMGRAIAGLGFTVDQAGNIFWADQEITEYLASSPNLESSTWATLGTDSGTFIEYGFLNTGNAPLEVTQVSFPPDFPQGQPLTSGIFPPVDVPNAGVCAAGLSVPPSSVCGLPVDFYPITPMGGKSFVTLKESVVLTSNARGGLVGPVSLPVSADESAPWTKALLSLSADPATVGQTVTLTVKLPGTAILPTGTVSFYQLNPGFNSSTLLGTVQVTHGQASYDLTGLPAGTSTYMAEYSGDENYQGQVSIQALLTVVEAPGVKDFGDGKMGTLAVGTAGDARPLTITFAAAETLGSIDVLTLGNPNLDFQDAGNGTCKVGQSYPAGGSCTVNVVFQPTVAGHRHGAVVLKDGAGDVVGTGYLQGGGVGPVAEFNPPAASYVPNVPQYPKGVALDAAGNVYLADGWLYKLAPGNGTYTQTILLQEGNAYDVAIDGGGNLYVTGGLSSDGVHKLTPSPSGYVSTALGYGFQALSVAVDGDGNVFVAGEPMQEKGHLFKLTPAQGSYIQTTITPPSNERGPCQVFDIALDGSGNLYVSCWNPLSPGSPSLYKGTPSGNAYTWSGVGDLSVEPGMGSVPGIAVDLAGNVYAVIQGGIEDGSVVKEVLQPDGSYKTTTLPLAEKRPWAITVDSLSNVWVSGLGGLTKYEVANGALTFAATAKGAVSTDSPQKATLTNRGNGPLTITAVGYPSDFSLGDATASDCRPASLAVNESCTINVQFTPNAASSSDLLLNERVTVGAKEWTSPHSVAVSGTETATANETFVLSGTPVILTAGATTGNTSTITLTPANGFTGKVSLTASLASQPAGAQYLPTFSFGTSSPVNVQGTVSQGATLTITTTAPSTAAVAPMGIGNGWRGPAAGVAFTCVVLAWIPTKRRRLRSLAGLAALSIALCSGVGSCGGGGNASTGGSGGGASSSGTSRGAYAITVTGTSGSFKETCTLSLTVQ